MRSVRSRALATVALVVLCLPLAASTTGAAASKVIDRMLACTTGVRQGKRSIEVIGHAAFRKSGRFEWLASAYVSAPGKPVESRAYYPPMLAGVFAGWPLRPDLPSGSLGLNTTLCSPSRAGVSLTRGGLAGGASGPYLTGGPLECPTPKTILVRVRAAFFEPATLIPNDNGTFLQAIARPRKGQVAVRTPGGKRLVYSEVYDSGKARLFTAKSCT